MSEDIKSNWTAKQTYLVLGNLLNAAAELNIDSTPMEGFNPVQFNEILGLDKLNLNTALVVPVGYRHEEDDTQHLKSKKIKRGFIYYTIIINTKQIKQMKKFKINYFSISSSTILYQ
jgi:nitroreductase